MERSAVEKSINYSISDTKLASYKIAHQPVWVENNEFVIAKNYDLMLKADTITQEEMDKIEIKADKLILKDQLEMKFASEEIFYDVTKQFHLKLLKKAGKGGDNDEWEAEKMQKSEKNIKKKSEKCNVKECNLRKYIIV